MAIPIYNGAGKRIGLPKQMSATFMRDTYLEHDRMIRHDYSEVM